jgi:putative hydrolase of the HAD superfamily
MIHAILFDIGNVLLRFDYQKALNAMLLTSGTPVKQAARESEPLVLAYERGELDRETFLIQLAQIFKYFGTLDSLAAIWSDIFTPNQPMVDLVEAASEQCPLYLMSNTSDLHMEHVGKRYPFFSLFRDGVYSYRVGKLKPDPAIYAIAVEQLGVTPSETIYIDDIQVNVEAGAQAGFVACHYDPDRHDAFARWYAGFELGPAKKHQS